MRKILRALSVVGVTFATLVFCASPTFAQGCALCYTDAASTGPQAQAALRHGILVLMIPPMLMFAAMFGILYRRRYLHHEAARSIVTSKAMPSVSEVVLYLD